MGGGGQEKKKMKKNHQITFKFYINYKIEIQETQ